MVAARQRLLKRAGFLLAALGFLIAAALLMLKPAAPKVQRAALQFPHRARPHEIERQQRRSTLPPARREALATSDTATDAPVPAQAAREARDPLHVALAQHEASLIIESATLKDSPLGRMLLACLSQEHDKMLEELEEKTGLRVLEQVERIAIAGSSEETPPVLMLSGKFPDFDPSGLHSNMQLEPHGASSRLAVEDHASFGIWNDEIILIGLTESVVAALDRLEGNSPAESGPIAEEAYGEVYGTISGKLAGRLVPEQLRERLGAAAQRVTLHVDATDDLLLVADVYGGEPELLEELATTVGGALALGRISAIHEDDAMLIDLLDESRVIRGDGSFQLEMALPLATIQAQLGECAKGAP
jgi:hypothetical protein